MAALLERIAAGEVLLSDGGMGTQLFARGLQQGACPELFNLERPDVIEEIAGLYAAAGADIVHTNTFGGTPLRLGDYDLAERCEEINIAALQAAKLGAQGKALVSASCGPTGKLLEPFGDTTAEAISESFVRQCAALVEAGVDAITVETMTDLTEAVLAVKAVRQASATIPVLATMTFEATRKGFRTIMGVTLPQACEALAEAGADLVGSNCGNGIGTMLEIAAAIAECSDLPIIIQSNAGLPLLEKGEVVYPESPEYMAEQAKSLLQAGVAVIGGCCGTTPEHIRALRRVLDRSDS